ncbi:MAG: lptD [Rickettsiaceae bacterium]|jgi:LPS-assembly protein|nr:lptD [Rickettsiaceae bacterium]
MPIFSLRIKYCAVFIAAIVIFLIPSSWAAGKKTPPKNSLPAVLKANQIEGDRNSNVINATGNVELTKDGNTLFTDQLSYDKGAQDIQALGNIRIKNYDIGNILAEKINLKSDFKSGNFDDAVIVFNDGSYIKSPAIIRNNESETVINQPVFSICPNDEIKENNKLAGKDSDVISITSSSTTTIDKSTNSIKTKDGVIRFYDVPVLYIPYLKTPLPSSKRKSGFLHPSYIRTTKLGFGLKVPYYFNIAPDKDLTSTLQYHPSKGHLILDNEYRQLLENGLYNIDLELANNKPKTNSLAVSANETSDQNLRWRLISGGNLKFQKDLELNFFIDNVGDKNYLQDYHNQFVDHTVSEANLNYIKDRNYAEVKTVKIQELGINRDEREEPVALPIINYYVESKAQPGAFQPVYDALLNSTVITRRSGLQYRRLSAKPEIKLPYNLGGNLFELSSNIQTDFYNMENNYTHRSRDNNYEDFAFNYRPEASLKWSLPLVGKYKTNTIVIEPLTNITISSYKNGGDEIPNEDTNNTELTQSNLFLSDRFTGFDRNETGGRLTYGFKSSLFNDSLGQFNLGLGQSFRSNNKTQDVIIRGFNNNNKSNIVGEFGYRAPKIFSIVYNFQLNESSYRNDINEVVTGFDFGKVRIGTDYILIRRTVNNAEPRKQINFNFGVNITKKLVFDASTTRNLINRATISKRYGLTYNGCCVSYGFAISEDNPTILARPQRSYNINFAIKNL